MSNTSICIGKSRTHTSVYMVMLHDPFLTRPGTPDVGAANHTRRWYDASRSFNTSEWHDTSKYYDAKM